MICTAPPPQSADLLPESFAYHSEIKAITMRPCLSLMLGFSQTLPLEFDAAHITDSAISWIAVNSNKPGRPTPFTLVAHSSEDYAKVHIDDDDKQLIEALIEQTSRIIGHDVSTADYRSIHRWRYANNTEKDKTCPVFLDKAQHLAVCGDWTLGGRVENAYLSAYNLAAKIKKSAL